MQTVQKVKKRYSLFTNKQLLWLIAPIVIENIFSTSLGMFDGIMVSSIDEFGHASNAVGNVDYINNLVIQLFSKHLGNELNSREIFDFILTYKLSVSENCDLVADCVYLLKEVGYKDNSNAFCFQVTHHFEQLLNFTVIQRRCRFIENQDFTVHINSTGNGNHLLNRDGIA